jgi:Transposase DDE domain group 1
VAEIADNLRFHHAKSSRTKLRTYASFTYQAGTWTRPRKVVARLECSLRPDVGDSTSTGMLQEVDIRYVVTSLKGTAQHLYEDVYCQRGQMENLIKLHKAQLACDAPRAPDQDRGARDRTYRAHSRPVADELPGGSTVPRRCAWPDAVRPLSHGAACPDEPPTRQINSQCVAQRVEHTDPGGRIDGMRAPARQAKTRGVMHDPG